MTQESLEPTTISISKAVATILLASTPWINQLDFGVRLGGGFLAIVVGVLTIRGLLLNYKIKSVEKRLKDMELEEAIKRSLNGKH